LTFAPQSVKLYHYQYLKWVDAAHALFLYWAFDAERDHHDDRDDYVGEPADAGPHGRWRSRAGLIVGPEHKASQNPPASPEPAGFLFLRLFPALSMPEGSAGRNGW
jgi:hypothetical protein